MANAIFNAKINLSSATATINPMEFDVVGSVVDNEGLFSGLDASIGSILILDTSGASPGTISRYKIMTIAAQGFSSISCKIRYDDVGAVIDPAGAVGIDGMICDKSPTDRMPWLPSIDTQALPAKLLVFAGNIRDWATVDGNLGGGGGGGALTVDVTLSSAQILSLDTTPVTLLAAPGAAFFYTIESCEIFLIFATTPYTGGGDLQIDYLSNPIQNLFLDQACVLAGANSRRYGAPVDNPLPDVTELAINEPIVIRSNPSIAFVGGDSSLKVRLRYNIFTALT